MPSKARRRPGQPGGRKKMPSPSTAASKAQVRPIPVLTRANGICSRMRSNAVTASISSATR